MSDCRTCGAEITLLHSKNPDTGHVHDFWAHAASLVPNGPAETHLASPLGTP